MGVYKTVPNQKVVKVNKEKCDKQNLYATINLDAMESAAMSLKAGAFKLWVYFAKNQNNYEFALSSKAVLDTFGMKKDQYDSAVKELIDKGYLVVESGNRYIFTELVGKNHNESQNKNALQEKTTTELQEKPTTLLQEKTTTACSKNPQEILQDTTLHNTINNTSVLLPEGNKTATAQGAVASTSQKVEDKSFRKVSRKWLEDNGIEFELVVGQLGYVKATGCRIEVIDD